MMKYISQTIIQILDVLPVYFFLSFYIPSLLCDNTVWHIYVHARMREKRAQSAKMFDDLLQVFLRIQVSSRIF